MLMTDKQFTIIKSLMYNLDKIKEALDNLMKMEIEGNKVSITYKFNIQNLQLALKTNDELLQNDIFDYNFIKMFKEYLISSINKYPLEKQKLVKRLLRDIQNRFEDSSGIVYSRDLNITTLCILENYIISNDCEPLNKELLKFKYELALKNPEFTEEFVEKNFEFMNNIGISNILNSDNKGFNTCIYLQTIIELCAKDLLKYNNEDYKDITKSAKIMFLSFKIQAAMMFLQEELTWDFFEERLDIDENNTYSINILKSTLGKKSETRKLVF